VNSTGTSFSPRGRRAARAGSITTGTLRPRNRLVPQAHHRHRRLGRTFRRRQRLLERHAPVPGPRCRDHGQYPEQVRLRTPLRATGRCVMVLIVIAVVALHRRIRARIQQHAASQDQQGLAEHARSDGWPSRRRPHRRTPCPSLWCCRESAPCPDRPTNESIATPDSSRPANWSQPRGSSDGALYSRVLRVAPDNAKSAGAANDIHHHR